MKKVIIVVLGILIFSYGNAQELPINSETKLITYTEVVEQNGSADELYKKSYRWFFSYYKNPHNIVKESANNKIVAQPRFKILNPKNKKGVATMGGIVKYSFTVIFKDGRYKYDITNIEWKQTSKYPIERWNDKTAKSYQEKYAYYLEQVNSEINKVLSEMKTNMAKNPKKDADNW